MEHDAREKAKREAAEARAKNEAHDRETALTGKKKRGRRFTEPDPDTAKPDPKAQRNFTDPESRIMVDGATKSFMQAYNVQIAVDGSSQVILAAAVTQQAVDSGQLIPMLGRVAENVGELPIAVTADAGYYSEANPTAPQFAAVDFHVPPNRREASTAAAGGQGCPKGPVAVAMRAKLNSPAGKAVYRLRKAIVEPVFGQVKDARGIRGSLFRGFEKVGHEWTMICMTHNLLKLFRAGQLVASCRS